MRFEDINSEFLRGNYLFGIPLQDQYGNQMKEGMLDHYIKAAIQHTQRMLQVVIEPEDIVDEVHDQYRNDFENWAFFQLHKRPIINVTSLTMYYGSTKAYDIPRDWIRPYSTSGQIQLMPNAGSAGSMIITAGGAFGGMVSSRFSYAPSMWRISYRAGMDEIPDDLVEYIMKRASVGILQVWGDLIIGAGIANQTISIDGLSQSIGTTQSPEFSGAGARIKNYNDDMRELEKRLRDTYTGINLGLI